MLEVHSLTRTYQNQETPAVKGVSFSLPEKKILSIFGRSGSGKTTLLKMIAGLLQPDSGSISLDGETIKGPESKLVPGHEEIKVVFQDFQLKHKMTVEENVAYTLLPYEEEYRKERLEIVISLCLLEEFRNKYIEELSGGQKQRVAIARAIANEPRLLLMDEPFSSLDISAKSTLRNAIRNITKETESSVIFVSHDPDEVLQLSDQILVIDNGEAIQSGSPKNIYDQPLNQKIAGMFSHLIEFGEQFYRPESFDLKPDLSGKFLGIVLETMYLGKYQNLIIKTDNNDQIQLIDYQFIYQKNDKVSFDLLGNPIN